MLFCFLILLVSCGDSSQPNGEKPAADKPSNIIKQAHIYRSSNANVNIEIFAPLVINYPGDSSKMEFPKGVKAVFFNKDMTTKSVLTADYAVNLRPSNDYILRQNVKIVNYNTEDTIYCQDLIWQSETQQIYTQKPIKRISRTGTDYGEGLKANEAMDSVIIIKPHGTQIVEEEEEVSTPTTKV
ncbi:MAG: LPS export ABC transporter periplasmic protein LptC [Bacteroidales bacterium]|jgi:LPS export ABC transporter protein LptC|nr:LPS export ABC transporter periplasmic protein LptC [Bacteroidales bacterium]